MAQPCRPAVVGVLPRSLYLETTNRCDSKCQTCIRTFETLEPPADLTLERVRMIAEQFPALDRVVLHGIGEPLIESGLDEYRVSMDAATSATFRKLRGVDRFERVKANVARLVALQREMGRTTPRVSLWFTASRANVEELPAFVQLAAELGVSEVYVQRLVFNGLGLATDANALHGRLRERERALLAEADALATRHGIAMRASGLTTPLASLHGGDDGTRHWAGCQRPWTLAYVTANGNVLPCCISPWVAKDYGGLILGNAFTERFDAIWDGERYQRFRTDFESDTPPDPCRGCGRLWSI
jgi:MoaA/NifB/PqqE/SkfB family radical SAM enzyme